MTENFYFLMIREIYKMRISEEIMARIIEDKHFAVLRIIFGLVWLIDAIFKWSPSFINSLTSYLKEGAAGQPFYIQAWVQFWINTVSVDPHFFAVLVAIIETAIALGLIFGILTKITISGGTAMALVIWTTAEGFGGPYAPGSTDIGTAIIYVIVFIALWMGKSWRYYSCDVWLRDKKIFTKWIGDW